MDGVDDACNADVSCGVYGSRGCETRVACSVLGSGMRGINRADKADACAANDETGSDDADGTDSGRAYRTDIKTDAHGAATKTYACGAGGGIDACATHDAWADDDGTDQTCHATCDETGISSGSHVSAGNEELVLVRLG